MSKPEILNPNGLQLVRITNSPIIEGHDKVVYKMTDGLNTVAAKVFKTNQQIRHRTETIPQTSRIQRIDKELEGYMQLRESPMYAYLPSFHYLLLNAKKERVGLAFSWEEGMAITNLHGAILEEEEVEDFEVAVFTTIAFNIRPYTDCLDTHNMFFNPQRNPKLWLAEYDLEAEYNDPLQEKDLYLKDIDDIMTELRRHSYDVPKT